MDRVRLRRSSSTSRRGNLYWLRKLLRNKTSCLLLTLFLISGVTVLGVALRSTNVDFDNIEGNEEEARVNAAPAIGIVNEIAAGEEPAEVFELAGEQNAGNNEVLVKSSFVDLSNLEFYTNLPGLIDKSGEFVLHAFHQIADSWETLRPRKLCLATQTSVDHLHWIVNMSSTWTGHASITVFAPAYEFHLAQMAIYFFRECLTEVRDHVTFHLVSVVDHPPKLLAGTQLPKDVLDCSNIVTSWEKFSSMVHPPELSESWREQLRYPQNLMRNWARSGCNSERILTVDVDMIPGKGMADELEDFFTSGRYPLADCKKCLIIVPTYEIAESTGRFPNDKSELVEWVNNGDARIFHISFWPRSCRSSRLEEWQKVPQGSQIELAYNITNIELQYEPIYIGPPDIPPFDERFVGYGHDRYTQFYDLYLSNYTFHILNNPFTCHWEFQEEKTRQAWKKVQRIEGQVKAWELAKELVFKHGRDPLRFEPYMKSKLLQLMRVNAVHKSDVNPAYLKYLHISGNHV